MKFFWVWCVDKFDICMTRLESLYVPEAQGTFNEYSLIHNSCKVLQNCLNLCSSGLYISFKSSPAQKTDLLVDVSTIPLLSFSTSSRVVIMDCMNSKFKELTGGLFNCTETKTNMFHLGTYLMYLIPKLILLIISYIKKTYLAMDHQHFSQQ